MCNFPGGPFLSWETASRSLQPSQRVAGHQQKSTQIGLIENLNLWPERWELWEFWELWHECFKKNFRMLKPLSWKHKTKRCELVFYIWHLNKPESSRYKNCLAWSGSSCGGPTKGTFRRKKSPDPGLKVYQIDRSHQQLKGSSSAQTPKSSLICSSWNGWKNSDFQS